MTKPRSIPALTDEQSDSNGSESYVSYALRHENERPPVTWSNWWKEVHWVRFSWVIIMPPLAAIYACFTPLRRETAIWSLIFYIMSGMGMTAGYHRLWSHRSYNATFTLEIILVFLCSATVMGPIIWWARLHRAHHRYIDTDLDPYNAKRGLFWTHIGWVMFKPRCEHGRVDISDLLNNSVLMWQFHYYPWVVLVTAIIFPTMVAGLGWGDWQGGFVYSALLRLFCVHHTTFCVNSVAHWIGDTPYDDKHSPRDHFLISLLTLGEGYHNFHHQFPMDYRNAVKWYQYDPTKWFIWLCHKVGLASHLKTFSENEIRKGELTMELKRLRKMQDALTWPRPSSSLPVLSWASYQSQAESRAVVCIAGFIHDIEDFLDVHPGGRRLLLKHVGQDATSAFFGGIYDHSNAAHNLLAMKRVGILRGGVPHISEEKLVPPSQWLRVVHVNEFGTANAVPSQRDTGYRINYSAQDPSFVYIHYLLVHGCFDEADSLVPMALLMLYLVTIEDSKRLPAPRRPTPANDVFPEIVAISCDFLYSAVPSRISIAEVFMRALLLCKVVVKIIYWGLMASEALHMLFNSRLELGCSHISLAYWIGAALTVVGCLIRVVCYRTLGHMFTFTCTVQPVHRLITHGPYAYVRHPSYTGIYMCVVGIVMAQGSPGSWLRESGMLTTLWGIFAVLVWSWSMGIVCICLMFRMKDEDELLKELFRDEWTSWASRVKYCLVPGVY